jgi:sterol desaturase/sphingolipid hydroxylase (fatty acid hydroxylase superfamily)
MLKAILIVAVIYLVLERVMPGVEQPAVRTWWPRAIAINLAQLCVVLLAGMTWERWLGSWSIFSLSPTLNPVSAGLAAYFISTFVFYWWHRARHESDFLWRTLHQIHHSARRIELLTSFYKHPLEMVLNSVISSVLIYTVLGLGLEAAAVYTFLIAIGEFFYHANIRTPHWIGYFLQRPEMHRIHHQYRRHKGNYSDIVWWDMLFGTYENPAKVACNCGFDAPQEQRLIDMLAFHDVHLGQNRPLEK